MKTSRWILGSAVVLYLVGFAALGQTILQPSPAPDATVIQGGNGKGKGPKCKTEPICDPTQCQQVSCETNNPCKCVCVPIPGCGTEPQ